jgi:glyoxylase I family protein
MNFEVIIMLSLEHVGICANDTRTLKDWYIKLFDLKVVYDNKKDKPTYFLVMGDKSLLEIYPAASENISYDNKYQGIRHLAFGTDNIEEEYKKLIENNVEIIDDLKGSANGVKTVFFKDPEGNILHFIQREKSLIESF